MKRFLNSMFVLVLIVLPVLHLEVDGKEHIADSAEYNAILRELKEIKAILNYWQNSRIIPNLALCTLEDGSNLAMKNTIVGYEEYIPIDTLPLNDKETYTGEEE